MKRMLILFVVLLSHAALGQAKKVSSEEILKAALAVKQAAEAADAVNEDAIRYCHATKSKVTAKDLESEISAVLLKPDRHLPDSVAASGMWEVASIADTLEFDVGLDTMHCALLFNEDNRAQTTGRSGLTAYSNLSDAKVAFEALAQQQTMWEEQQQRAIREQ
jgi:hypothetical protein